jgi:hypothetical protein
MLYYYVHIVYGSKLAKGLQKADFYDLTEKSLKEAIVGPYLRGRQVLQRREMF